MTTVARLDGGMRKVKREVREKEEEKWEMMEDWSDKAGTEFEERTEELKVENSEVDVLDKLIKKVKERIIMKRRRKREGSVRKWWNGECSRKKKEEDYKRRGDHNWKEGIKRYI